jgi:phosphohistidine swiveling domain-containing protein
MKQKKWEKLVERESDFWKNAVMMTALDDTRKIFGIEILSYLTTRRGMRFTHWIDSTTMISTATQIERAIQQNPQFINRVKELFEKSHKALILFNKRLAKTNISSLSDAQLLSFYKHFTTAYKSLYPAFNLSVCVESLSNKEDRQVQKFIDLLGKIRLVARQEFENAHIASQGLFKEIGSRNDLSFDEVKWLGPHEIEILIRTRNTPANSILKQRKFACVLFFNKRHYKILEGNEADKYIKRKVDESETSSKINKISGSAAYSGVAQGSVATIIKPTDISKMKKGNILVSKMTTPNLLPAVQLAAAIITDEGGITCHAAVLSRELKIPCIVGTKFATKALKDNDIVKVDANNGIVSIIS